VWLQADSIIEAQAETKVGLNLTLIGRNHPEARSGYVSIVSRENDLYIFAIMAMLYCEREVPSRI